MQSTSPTNEQFVVSVIVPTYNRRTTLTEALRSVLEQELLPHEIIVVDDCCTDGTADLDLRSLDPRIRMIRHDHNRGGAAARNTGIDNAIGNWLAFLDSDDLWLPHKLMHQSALVQSHSGTRFFVAGNVISRRPNRAPRLFNSRAPTQDEDLSEYIMIHDCTFQTSSLLVPAEAFCFVRFDETLRKHQDADFVLRLIAARYNYVYSHQPVAIYNQNDDPERISNKERSVQITLQWFRRSQHITTSAARAYYYTYRRFPSHLRDRPLEALQTALQLALTDIRSFRYALFAVLRLVIEKAFYKGIRALTGHEPT